MLITNFKIPEDMKADWEPAKREAFSVMSKIAELRGLILYSNLTKRIHSIQFEPWESMFHYFLGEISSEENMAGRGMLTAVVVREKDMRPGGGFLKLAESLGRDIDLPEVFWQKELENVYRVWSKKR